MIFLEMECDQCGETWTENMWDLIYGLTAKQIREIKETLEDF